VVAAAVILDDRQPIRGLADSKALSPRRRERLFDEVRAKALACCIAEASVEEIDTLNILQATMLAMRRALAALAVPPQHVIIDGNRCPDLGGLAFQCTAEAVVKGDALVASVSAASILAKVARDEHMRVLDGRHPGYGLADHKGYPTAAHIAALRRLGPSPVHRRSFAPVQSCDSR